MLTNHDIPEYSKDEITIDMVVRSIDEKVKNITKEFEKKISKNKSIKFLADNDIYNYMDVYYNNELYFQQ